MNFKELAIDQSWTLFLDRDGVINHKLPNDYVKTIDEFEFIEGSKKAVAKLSELFGRIVLVTNQQGIAKRIMTKEDLEVVHNHMLSELMKEGGKLDAIYYCPDLEESKSNCRKPNTGMAESARNDFPEIDFKKSIMVGDSLSDMQMGKRVGMITVYIHPEKEKIKEADLAVKKLYDFSELITS